MKAVTNAKVVLEDGVLEGGYVVFEDTIKQIGMGECPTVDEAIDAKGAYLFPGLVDLHIHGFEGDDASDCDVDGLNRMKKALTKNGVTTFCPTTMTVAIDKVQEALDCIKVAQANNVDGAKIAGVNVEGPFINPLKKGAQSAEHIIAPNAEFILKNKDIISLVTVAPEVNGGIEFVKQVSSQSNIVVSMGHTNANCEEATTAIKSGASHVTHLFNAMPPLTHRAPGLVGAVVANDSVSCELIADTFHVSTSLYPMLLKLKGDKLILITDCMRAGGMEEGNYTLGGQDVTVKGVECKLKDGTIAGSILTLNKAVYNFATNTGLSLQESVKHASLYPARVLGIDASCGSIAVGKCADMFLADEKMQVISTFVDGKMIV